MAGREEGGESRETMARWKPRDIQGVSEDVAGWVDASDGTSRVILPGHVAHKPTCALRSRWGFLKT